MDSFILVLSLVIWLALCIETGVIFWVNGRRWWIGLGGALLASGAASWLLTRLLYGEVLDQNRTTNWWQLDPTGEGTTTILRNGAIVLAAGAFVFFVLAIRLAPWIKCPHCEQRVWLNRQSECPDCAYNLSKRHHMRQVRAARVWQFSWPNVLVRGVVSLSLLIAASAWWTLQVTPEDALPDFHEPVLRLMVPVWQILMGLFGGLWLARGVIPAGRFAYRKRRISGRMARIMAGTLPAVALIAVFLPEDFRILSLVLVNLVVVGLGLDRARTREEEEAETRSFAPEQARFEGRRMAYLLLLPTLVILTIFLYYPTIRTFIMSLYLKPRRIGAPLKYVGLSNFARLAQDPDYLDTVGVTLFIAVAVVIIGMGISLAIATLAMQPIRGASIYRTLLIWPYAMSPAIAGAIFLVMFNAQAGIMGYFTDTLFGIKPDWLGDPQLAPWVVIGASVWKSLGFNILFYMAGLQNIPGALLEAAAIDGANRVQRFFRITFPLLSPITFFLLITNLNYAFFGIFGMVNILTEGGPVGATEVMIYKIYTDRFESFKIGLAASESIILFLLVVGLTLLQFRTTERRVHYGG